MLQLSGLDTAFLNMETETSFGHVSQLIMLNGERFKDTGAYAAIRAHIGARVSRLPPLYRRLVTVPMSLDRPYWINAGDVDLDFHVRHIGVPPPGGEAELAGLVARLIGQPLHRGRPLWELYVIEGLKSGEIALLLKLHHAAVDGASSMQMYQDLFDPDADVDTPTAATQPLEPEAEPEPWELLTRSYFSLLRSPARVLGLYWDALGAMQRLATGAVPGSVSPWPAGDGGEPFPVAPVPAPRTPFNAAISAHRLVSFAPVPLARIKAIKQAAGTTLNDVVMAICGGALRNYLLRKNVLPQRPLIAMVPVSVRTGEEEETFSNQVSSMLGELATDEADPRARLARVAKSMQAAKNVHQGIPASLLQDFSRFASPAVAAQAARVVAEWRLADRMNPICNVVISNVPGPRETLYLAGAEVTALIPVSTIGEGMGLNMTVVSYRDRIDFGYVACRDLVPDLDDLIEDTKIALDELAGVFGTA